MNQDERLALLMEALKHAREYAALLADDAFSKPSEVIELVEEVRVLRERLQETLAGASGD